MGKVFTDWLASNFEALSVGLGLLLFVVYLGSHYRAAKRPKQLVWYGFFSGALGAHIPAAVLLVICAFWPSEIEHLDAARVQMGLLGAAFVSFAFFELVGQMSSLPEAVETAA